MLLPLFFAQAAEPPPIVNGETTSLYPQAVLLRRADPRWNVVYVCTGTLVAPQWVLTAAHCVVDTYDEGLTEMHSFVGNAWTADAEEVVADHWFPHPDYFVSSDGLTIDSDLGLVHLSEPVDLEPIALNTEPITESDVGEVFRWVGWGASGDYAYDAGTLKRYGDIPLVGLEDEFILGYDERGAATCGGDSGGPVFRTEAGGDVVLIAAHSFGRDDDGTLCDGSTSGDTRVDLYVDWIRAEIGDPTGGDDTGVTDDTGDTDGGDTDVPEADDTAGGEGDEAPSGCGCAASAPGVGAWIAVSGLGLALARRRRA